MIVNLNVMCKVQLNEEGKQIWLSQINGIPDEVKRSHPEIAQSIRNKIDVDGCLELTLWEIMNMFGPYISQTSIPFAQYSIQLHKNPHFRPNGKNGAPKNVNK